MVKQWIIDGLSDREMSARRAELAEAVGVSLRSLASVSAYVRYPATVAIRVSGLGQQIDRDQLIWAAAFLETASDDAERADLLRECGEHLGVDPERLERAVRVYHEEHDRKPNGLFERETVGGAADNGRNATTIVDVPVPETEDPGGLQDLVAPSPPEVMRDTLMAADELSDVGPHEPAPLPQFDSETDEDTAIDGGHQVEMPSCVGEEWTKDASATEGDDPVEGEPQGIDEVSGVGGDMADYDTQEKREWRDWWTGYIRDRFPAPRLREVFVICLPGRKVEPEISKYLELGIPPERIHAVEGSARVREEFIANASRLGVQFHTGPLLSVLPRLVDQGLRFDIVNYDFHGQFCRSQLRSLHQTPVSHDAIVIHNAMAKRENREMSDAMCGVDDSYSQVAEEEKRFIKGYVAAHPTLRALLSMYPTDQYDISEVGSLKEMRRSTVQSRVVGLLGVSTRACDKALAALVADTMILLTPEDRLAMKEESAARIVAGLSRRGSSRSYRTIAPFCLTMTIDLLKRSCRAKFLQQVDPIALGLTLWHVAVHDLVYSGKSQTYNYLSRQRPGKPPSPFLSGAGRVVSSGHLFRDHMEALYFCGLMVRSFWHFMRKEGGDPAHTIDVVNARGQPVGRGKDSTPDDRVVIFRNGARLASLRLKKLVVLASAVRKAEREFQLLL